MTGQSETIEVDAENLASVLAYLGFQQTLSAVDINRQSAYTVKGILGVVTAYREQMPADIGILDSEYDVDKALDLFSNRTVDDMVAASDYDTLEELVADARADAPTY